LGRNKDQALQGRKIVLGKCLVGPITGKRNEWGAGEKELGIARKVKRGDKCREDGTNNPRSHRKSQGEEQTRE